MSAPHQLRILLRSFRVSASVGVAATALLLGPFPALADGGQGGVGFLSPGGSGGSGFTGNAGSAPNPPGTLAGGGGGGAGGGAGGMGGNAGGQPGAGGAGGTSSSPNGSAGGSGDYYDGSGGGGGGYNGNGSGASIINNSGRLTGGNGGAGAAGFGPISGGGGGGAGGYGAVVAGSGASSNTGSITSGNGGAGGDSGGNFASAGVAGDGGVGVQFATSGALLTNSGTITGGNGGAPGCSCGGLPVGNSSGGAGISGTGLTVINSGTIIGGLAGDGVTRANAITFTGGTNVLQIQAGSSITGNVVAFSASDALQLGGTINSSFNVSNIGSQYQGFGTYAKVGSSTWALTGTTTSTANWLVSAGTLVISSDSNLGSTNGTLAFGGGILQTTSSFSSARPVTLNSGGGTFTPNSATTLTMSGAIGGTGGLTMAGPGSLVLSATNTYTGATTINGGTLALTGSGSIATSTGVTIGGSAVLDISGTTSGATIQSLAGSSTAPPGVNLGSQTLTLSNASGTYSGVIGGSGGLVLTAGTETLSGNNTFTGGTTIKGGTLNVPGGTLLGGVTNSGTVNASGTAALNGGIANNAGGTFIVNGGAVTSDSAFTNNGTLSVTGGTYTLNNANSLLSNSGTIGVSPGATLNAVAGGITNLAGGTITNNGTIKDDLNNSGTITNNAGASWTGNVASNSGTITNASTWIGNVSSSGTLNNSGTWQGSITNSGTFNLTAGTITGSVTNSGTLNASGGTIAGSLINTGTFKVSGTFTAGAFTNAAGSLFIFGDGTTISAIPFTHNGTISTTVAGNVMTLIGAMTGNGSINAVVNGQGQASLVKVIGAPGTVAIGGGAVFAVPQASYFGPSTTYTILSATGGITGQYSRAISTAPFLQPSLSYDNNNVYLTLTIGGFAAAAQTPNQAAVGRVLDAAVPTATGTLGTMLGNLATATAQQGAAVMTAIGGQNYAGFSQAGKQSAQLFMSNFAAQVGSASHGANRVALAEACSEEEACDAEEMAKWGAWGGGLGGVGTIGANYAIGGLTYNYGGFAAGIDRAVTQTLRLGATAGYSNGTQWVSGFQGNSISNTFQGGFYGTWSPGAFYLDGLAGYANASNQMTRPLILPGMGTLVATGNAAANQFFGQAETGYQVEVWQPSEVTVTPFARLQGSTSTQGAFSEGGAGTLGLNVAAQTNNSLRLVLGAQLGGVLDVGLRDKIALQLRAGWGHEYADTTLPVTASFVGAPSQQFTTYGVAPLRDSALIGLSASTAVASATSIYFRYEGNVSGQDQSHAFTAGVRVVW